MVAEGLARVYVGNVHLDHRQRLDALYGVEQGHRGVGESAGVEHHAGQLAGLEAAARFLDLVDQRTFVVALETLDRKAQALAVCHTAGFHVGQGGGAVHRGLARAEQVEVKLLEIYYDPEFQRQQMV